MWRRPFLIVFLTMIFALPASAARPFPPNAKRGTMSPATWPAITIDGQERHLAVGARIWNQNNLIQLPAYLQGDDLAINYTENANGDINRIWILTPEEASGPLPAAQ